MEQPWTVSFILKSAVKKTTFLENLWVMFHQDSLFKLMEKNAKKIILVSNNCKSDLFVRRHTHLSREWIKDGTSHKSKIHPWSWSGLALATAYNVALITGKIIHTEIFSICSSSTGTWNFMYSSHEDDESYLRWYTLYFAWYSVSSSVTSPK